MRNWTSFFDACTEEELEGIALLRVIECTNGCIQHAFRDSNPIALSVEKTREAMKFSMSLMKDFKFDLGGQPYTFNTETQEGLRYIRNLYVEAFKKGNEQAMDEFFEASIACVKALGQERISKAVDLVRAYCSNYLPDHTVAWGVSYLTELAK